MKPDKRIIGAITCACILAALAGTTVASDGMIAANPVQSVASADSVEVAAVEENNDISDDFEESTEVEGDATIIGDDEVPMGAAAASDAKTTTKKTSKTTKKTKKSKSKASKSKTVTKKVTSKNTKSSANSSKSIVTVTTKVTTEKSKYTRGSKTINVTTKIDTTIKTTTSSLQKKTVDIAKAAPKADDALLDTFKSEGFTFQYDNGLDHVGLFSPSRKSLTLRYETTVIYHELGHFLAYTTGKSDLTDEFAGIYKAEKSKFSGDNEDYVTQNAAEYFAESYRDYVTRKDTLKKQRPKTYAYIQKVLKKL